MNNIITIIVVLVVFNFFSIEAGDIIKLENNLGIISPTPVPTLVPTPTPIKPKNGDIIGRIIIEKIKVDLPIFEEASVENLAKGATHVLYTTLPWENGNCFVSAHRSWTYGRNFNRLDELKAGDIVKLTTRDKNYTYKVVAKETVLPENIEVFNEKYDLSLTTCTPIYTATHRLIVYCLRTK